MQLWRYQQHEYTNKRQYRRVGVDINEIFNKNSKKKASLRLLKTVGKVVVELGIEEWGDFKVRTLDLEILCGQYNLTKGAKSKKLKDYLGNENRPTLAANGFLK